MYPEDRVLVGVIRRKRDFEKARAEHWYRVPQGKAPKGVHAEYVAFYLSRAFGDENGGIRYYARRIGTELARRRDLLPEEATHKRADHWYHKLQLGELRRKDPPILNPTKRPVAFIYTTWDRFVQARVIADLYSKADCFVDRVYYALRRRGVRSVRVWEAEPRPDPDPAPRGAQIRVQCADGTVIASTQPDGEQIVPLGASDEARAVRYSVEAILEAIQQRGGPLTVHLPIEE